MTDHDPALQHLVDQVNAARSDGRKLDVRGGGTKSFYGEDAQGDPLPMRDLQ